MRNGALFADMPEELQRPRRGLLRQTGGDRVIAQVLAIVAKTALDEVNVAVELAMENSPPSGRITVQHGIKCWAGVTHRQLRTVLR